MSDDRAPLLAKFQELRTQFPLYGANCLKIREKNNAISPLVLNSAQVYLQLRIEDQIRRTGKVRLIVLKGRQQGISTLVGGRYYWKASLNKGVNVFILSHEQSASDTLFGMVDRYHRHNPLKPHVGASNVRELEFDRLESSYHVGTAGSKAGGRGKAMSLFHGSEVAFWPNAADHFASSVQTIPDLPGTEIILESTANGVSGEFYERWQDAIAGKGDYEAVFIPWFWQTEYSRTPPEGFELNAEEDGAMFSEVEYARLFNLSLGQMAWRRNKIVELRSTVTFDVEYPATSELAFQQKQEGAYHKAGDVLRARKREVEPVGPLVLGVDPAGEGGDRFAIAFRRGLCCYKIIWRDKIDHPTAVTWLQSVIDEHDPAAVFIDAGGLGKGIISSLRAKGPQYGPQRVKAVNFGSPSQAKTAKPKAPGPKNRRAEMQMRVKEWLALEEGVSIPDMDVLQADLVETKIKPDLNNNLQLESKQDIRKRGARSPDLADALGLTFAESFYVSNWTEVKKTPVFAEPTRQAFDYNAEAAFHDDFVGGGDDGWMS